MRFHVALDSLEKENHILRYSIGGLLFLTIILCFGILYSSMRDPLVIERACYSRSMALTTANQSPEEIEAFIELAIKARFDSNVFDSRFLNAGQVLARSREQLELQKQKMTQKISVNKIEFLSAGKFIVDADRLISVGVVRTVLRFPLLLEIGKVPRNEVNPYGLLIIDVQPNSVEKQKNEKGGEKRFFRSDWSF